MPTGTLRNTSNLVVVTVGSLTVRGSMLRIIECIKTCRFGEVVVCVGLH